MPEKKISMEAISCKKAIRCTTPSCPCECFSPAKTCLRTCDTCKHGWVAHALDKLGYRHVFNMGLQVEIVQPNIVFDIASLMLYGAQATPIRLKILLDRLFSVLQHEEVLQVLHGFGWTYEDYARGYILQTEDHSTESETGDQEASGRVLDKWMCATREEEYIIMQQFLRFGETKSIAQEIILADTKERQDQYFKQTSSSDSEIKKFIERSNMTMQTLVRPFDVRHLFGARLPYIGATPNRLMSPPIPGFSTPSSSPRDMRPPLISVSASSPVTSTPLSRLQTMQPFDFRREPASPVAISPGEKQPSTRESSPKSESPQNLSVVSSSSNNYTPPHTPYMPHCLSDMKNSIAHLPVIPQSINLGSPSMNLPTLPTHHSSCDGVINFSIKEDPDRKNKHLRKSSNPIKRNWIPDVNFGSPMIGPNGKKRVLCTACNKTFCDKGALKIHYSAVHLKEMHKCSVDGCTMMFSSRRSRNRHSANPNPKLHMPQKRPKMPEGATIIDDGTGLNQKRPLISPPSMLLAQSMITRSPVNLDDGHDSKSFYADSIQMPVFPSALKRLKLDVDSSDDDGPKDLSLPISRENRSREYSSREFRENMSLPVIRHDLTANDDSINIDTPSKESQDGSISGEDKESSMSNSPGLQRSQNRRKNIPTRCAPPTDRYNEHGELVEEKEEDEDDEIRAARKQNGIHDNEENKLSEENDVDMEDYGDRSDSKLVIDDDDEDDDDIDRNDTGEVLDFSMNVMDVSEGENISIVSGHESDGSFASNDSSDVAKSVEDTDIPVDKDNPKHCVTCGKTFLNVFGMKIHYKNVHLKLMHTCSVEGCSASFPSKRSRDRHSANLYLHRKLLSTTDEQNNSKNEADDNQNFRADVIQKLYQFQNINDTEGQEEGVNGKTENDISTADENKEEPCDSDAADEDKANGVEEEDELGKVNSDGMATCHICNIQVRDNLVLKEHFELNHPKEMFHCTINGCEKMFSTRKSRNRHSQNHNLHKSISPNGRAITA